MASQESRAGAEMTPSDVLTRLAADILVEAESGSEQLAAALWAAFQEAARRLDLVSLAVTGLSWLGAGVPSVEQGMSRLIRLARRGVALCSDSIKSGGLSVVLSPEV